MSLVYIAGPYTNPDPVINTRQATEAGLKVYERTGAGVLIPHLSLLAHAMFPRDIDFWYLFDLSQVAHCTHLLRLPGASTGADREVEYARGIGLGVYHDLDDLVADLLAERHEDP